MTSIITVANEKGGVAKTTTALSLGAALANSGQRVLLLDLDPQGDMTIALGIEPARIQHSMASALLGTVPMESIIHGTQVPGLDLVPSNHEMKLIERILPLRPEPELSLKYILEGDYSKTYSYIVMDCPPIIGMITQNALMASNLLLIPTQAEYFSIHALKSIMDLVRKVRDHGNPDLAYRMVITMLDRRNRIHRVLTDQLRSSFGTGLMSAAIEIDTRLRESPISGKPIGMYAPHSRAARQYQELADEVCLMMQHSPSAAEELMTKQVFGDNNYSE